MKTYIAILIGIVVLSGVVFGGYMYTKKQVKSVSETTDTVTYKIINGEVSRWFEGTSTLAYSFGVRQTATTSKQLNDLLLKVTDAGVTVANVYFSYEGGRGYTALDYISEIVAPHVSVITPTGTSTFGAYEWTTAETAGSNWYISSVSEGEWLVIVEGKKTLDLDLKHILETIQLEVLHK